MSVNGRTFLGFCCAGAGATLLPDAVHLTGVPSVRDVYTGSPLLRAIARLARGLLALTLAAAVSGCVAVRPWEREILAKRVMQVEPSDPTEGRLRESLLSYREGSTGALGTKGGGCGCD